MTAPNASAAAQLLSPDFMARLSRLELVSRRLFAGRFKGERRSRHRGTSVEFADYRNYAFGDEPRFIDWAGYARLERLFLKLFVEEEDLFVYFLIDTSRSMEFGNPAKLLHAKQIAAALSYISLLGMDRVSLAAFSTGLGPAMRPRRGRAAATEIFDYVARLQPSGGTSLTAAAERFAATIRRSGVVIVLSDFLSPDGHEAALRRLLHKKCEVYALHLISPDDARPTVAGDLRLIDSETSDQVEVTVTERLLRNYASVYDRWSDDLRNFCVARGIGYIPADTRLPFEDLVLKTLKTAGLLK